MALAVGSLWYLEQQLCREQSNWEPREKEVRGTGSGDRLWERGSWSVVHSDGFLDKEGWGTI